MLYKNFNKGYGAGGDYYMHQEYGAGGDSNTTAAMDLMTINWYLAA